MEKYVASSPESLISRRRVKALLMSMKGHEFADLIRQNGFDHVVEEEWYPSQQVLDLLKNFAERANGPENLISIGVKMLETSGLPQEVNSVSTALHLLNQNTQRNSCNTVGTPFQIVQHAENRIEVTDNTPYPHDVVYGYLYSICRRYLPKGSTFSIKRTYLNTDNPDADGARYHITW